MTKVNILGKEYKVAFNFKTILTYEQLTGSAFDINGVEGLTPQINLAWCAVTANNADAPEYNKFLEELTPKEYAELSVAVASEITSWYAMQPTSEPEEKNEESSKND